MEQVRIYRPAKTPTQSGYARSRRWLLEFLSEARRSQDPLMGWTGFDDMQSSQVRLQFDSREDAVAYAERAGLSYKVEEPHDRRVVMKNYAANFVDHQTPRLPRP